MRKAKTKSLDTGFILRECTIAVRPSMTTGEVEIVEANALIYITKLGQQTFTTISAGRILHSLLYPPLNFMV